MKNAKTWGRGIEKTNRECREHGIEPSLYDGGMSGLMVTFRANPAHLPAAPRAMKEGEHSEKSSVEVSVETPGRIVELLREHPHLTFGAVI